MPRRSNQRDRHDDFLSESDLSSSSSQSSDSSQGGSVRKDNLKGGPYRDDPNSSSRLSSASGGGKGYVNAPVQPPSSDEESQLEDEEKLIGQMIADKKKNKGKKSRRIWNMRSGPGETMVSVSLRIHLPHRDLPAKSIFEWNAVGCSNPSMEEEEGEAVTVE